MTTAYSLTLCDVAARGLAGVSLALLPGEIAGIVGPAGSGKSTVLQIAGGSLAAAAGEARVCGIPVASAAARGVVGHAPEFAAFPPALTVQEVLEYFASAHRLDRGVTRGSLVREALDLAGLTAAAQMRVTALGRADLQRLNLAQAALGGRRVLLLDEVLSGIDAVARRELRARIAHLAAGGAAVLVSARDPTVLERLAVRVMILRGGRLVRAGLLAALLGERVLEVILDAPPPEAPPGFRITAAGIEAPLAGRTVESALALCRAHRLAVRASRVRVKSLEDLVLETHDTSAH